MIKKIRFTYWLLAGFFKKHPKLLISSVALGVAGSLLTPGLIRFFPKLIPTEKIAIIGRPTLAELPMEIQNQISLGLTRITPEGEAQPALATSFRIEEEGKRYIFTLKKDVRWQDGKPFVAEDVKYNFQNVTTTVLSKETVAFDLKEPFAPLPTVVSQPLFRQTKSPLFMGRLSLIGLGPLRVRQIKRNGHEITDLFIQSDERNIHYRFYPTQESAVVAFKLGEVDKVLELSSPGELAQWPNTKIEEVHHKDRYVALFYNTNDQFLANKGFRQALTYAIPDKPTDDKRTISPISPTSWAFNPQVKPYEFSLEDAKRLLEGEKEGNPNFNPKLELTTTLPYLTTAEHIKEQWLALGIPTTVKVATFIPDSFQTLLIGQEIPPDPDQYSLWHSTQRTNLTRYNSPKIDKLLEDGRQIEDQKERTQIYQDFQRFLVEDSPASFLFHLTTYTIERS